MAGDKSRAPPMLFYLSKILEIVFAPGNLLLLLLLVGLWRLSRTRRRSGMGLAVLAALCFLVVAVTPVAQWLVAPLEDRFPAAPNLPNDIAGIVVLGGATNTSVTAAHGQVALNDSAERITEAVVLARRFPSARIVLSGGNGTLLPSGPSEAAATRDLLVAMGVDAGRLVLETKSRTTYENAVESKALAAPRPGEIWVLLTSGYHMPRAVGCFRKIGWDVLPDPVDFQDDHEYRPERIQLDGNLALLNKALHEWLGLAVYYATGRIDTLFPGPLSANNSR